MDKFIGGLRWGNAFWNDTGVYGNATFPLANLKIVNNSCILTWTFWWLKSTSYVLPFEDINYVTTESFLFNKGILFVHTNKDIPKYLLFWTFYLVKVCNTLKSYGIKVLS